MQEECISIWREQNIRDKDTMNFEWLAGVGSHLTVGKDGSLRAFLEGVGGEWEWGWRGESWQ